jgi:hypothetical protein
MGHVARMWKLKNVHRILIHTSHEKIPLMRFTWDGNTKMSLRKIEEINTKTHNKYFYNCK